MRQETAWKGHLYDVQWLVLIINSHVSAAAVLIFSAPNDGGISLLLRRDISVGGGGGVVNKDADLAIDNPGVCRNTVTENQVSGSNSSMACVCQCVFCALEAHFFYRS